MGKDEGTRITTLETSMTFIKDSLDKIEEKLDKFIEKADDKYAQKSEVIELKGFVKTAIVTAVIGVLGFLVNALLMLWQNNIK